MEYRIHSGPRHRRIYTTHPQDYGTDNDSSLTSSFRPRQNQRNRDEDPPVWPYFLSLLVAILVIVLLYNPVYSPSEESYDHPPGTVIASTTTTTIARPLTGKITARTSTSCTTPTLQPASPNNRLPKPTTEKETSAIKTPPIPPAEDETQPFILHEHMAWISYVPSLYAHPEHWPNLPQELDKIPGGELGLFGAAHLAPDQTADKGNPECFKLVARAASRQRAFFDPEAKFHWTSPLAWMSIGSWKAEMSDPQMEIVKKIIDAAEKSAMLACMTEKERKDWAKEEARRLDEKALKEQEVKGSSKWWLFWRLMAYVY